MWDLYKKILAKELFNLIGRCAKSENMDESFYYIIEEKNGTFTVNIQNSHLQLKYQNFMNKEDAEIGLKMLLELLGYEQEKKTYH